MIGIDESAVSIVAYCTACKWSMLAGSRDGAHELTSAHEALVHPGDGQAVDAASAHRRRGHAVAYLNLAGRRLAH